MSRVLVARNAEAVPADDVPRLPLAAFQGIVADALTAGGRVVAYFGEPAADGVTVTAALANDREHVVGLLSTSMPPAVPSLAEECPALQLFERELAEQHGVVPVGHPWPKPVRFEPPRPGEGAAGRPGPAETIPGAYPFFAVAGEEVHEVAVGPVHAGIIEPGHFRFQCHGENVFHLEIVLGYQHRGVERLLEGGPDRRTVALVESIAGDTTVGHALAHARALEALCGIEAPPRAVALRAVALELERLANHVGDLGALATDIGFLPTASYCGALRAEFLNAVAEICGNRFGRGLVVPGGVRFDLPDGAAARLAGRVAHAWEKAAAAARLFFRAASVRNRTDGTGVVTTAVARELGLVGPAGRASGLAVDVRATHPFAPYETTPIPIVTHEGGDVSARARVRRKEAEHSAAFVVAALSTLPLGPVRTDVPAPRPDRLAVSLVEGWRGEICHAVRTGPDGRFARYQIVDPSFHNWMGLQLALRGQQISDFPLCNKSFNLSYCGHDL
ncbi:hydrogenase large subunit [Anaeromyxobacter oryzae]|uniref:Hydrogenase n=1 Tax=Anaeromyxobacter oryzae TaxID=2918170 RepID=A0ABN6MNI6_9BACT|nr:hydrogenase [Anaeromyxobacter oryzae]BDG02571.1 hydrogenase [Anaeromyxobacter oryzae]